MTLDVETAKCDHTSPTDALPERGSADRHEHCLASTLLVGARGTTRTGQWVCGIPASRIPQCYKGREPKAAARDFGNVLEAYAGRSLVALTREQAPTPETLEHAPGAVERLVASGTFVRVGRRHGILTCAHVVEFLLDQGEIGLVCFPARVDMFQRIRFRLDERSLVILKKRCRATGEYADLAFVPLCSATAGQLAARATAVDLLLQAWTWRQPVAKAEFFVDVVAGAVGEWSERAIFDGARTTTIIEALLNAGYAEEPHGLGSFDSCDFRPNEAQGIALPERYSGISGGGLWRFYVRRANEDSFELVERRLNGVAVGKGIYDDIACHGPLSIYEALLPRLIA